MYKSTIRIYSHPVDGAGFDVDKAGTIKELIYGMDQISKVYQAKRPHSVITRPGPYIGKHPLITSQKHTGKLNLRDRKHQDPPDFHFISIKQGKQRRHHGGARYNDLDNPFSSP